ncbi:hypothetical protein PTSG_08011 [Salpingoeca rosetta]|uniref:Sulfatase N-terminal domain-containing protein n=1 Tax=Salpingoeca rosetta (strain ATCC 50818 / BSB-021) TaxID=946362 RepID=F2UHR2_SALR5|nr:uncharacterized protein PTSG_08011 [Salpingoeca rosetta]EGD76661.1 hypothetical protein PTSG_08011 [Salpingoeca rosetta]|eukprot:XP_004991033.1 hypothetical protein PTSG_08011 [Salpingoeca rosetta]
MGKDMQQQVSAHRPHILFVVVDDHGWNDCGFAGTRVKTPTIDTLRSEGIALNQHYVQKVCSPTRAALMTGRYPHRYGLQFPFCGGAAMALNSNETLLPQYMKSAGYTTRAVGKWHLGFTEWQFTPTFRGFDSFYGFYSCAEDYFFHGLGFKNSSGAHVKSLDFHDDARPSCGADCSKAAFEAVGTDWQHYSTTLFAGRIVDIVDGHDPSQPLFLYFASQDTHNPGEVPQCYKDRYNTTVPDQVRRKLAAKLTTVDSALANITEAYKRNGMYDNLLIVYTADNGGPITVQSGPNKGKQEDSIGSSNYPLRGGKHNAYEGGVRSTAFLSGPALKTLARLVRKYQYKLHIGDCGQFHRPGDWSNPTPWTNVTASKPSTYSGYPYQLFDVMKDPNERHDLINDTAYAHIVDELKAIYERERAVAHYPETRGPPGKPVYIQDPNPLSSSMPVWLPWLNGSEVQFQGPAVDVAVFDIDHDGTVFPRDIVVNELHTFQDAEHFPQQQEQQQQQLRQRP